MKRLAISIGILIIIVLLVVFYQAGPTVNGDLRRVSIGDKVTYTVEIADEPAEQALGLGQRDSLAEGHGMLFTYEGAEDRTFWMKGMRFPLDFIWIRDGIVIGLNSDIQDPVSTGDQIITVPSPVAVDWVLEVNAGEIVKWGIEVGDAVDNFEAFH